MSATVEIWGYGLMDSNGLHQIQIASYELEEGQSVFVGTLQVHHISIDDDGVMGVALDRPLETIEITQDASGIWLAAKPWEKIARDLPPKSPGTITGRSGPSQPGMPPGLYPTPAGTHIHNPDKCVQCGRCSGCTISHSAGCDAAFAFTPKSAPPGWLGGGSISTGKAIPNRADLDASMMEEMRRIMKEIAAAEAAKAAIEGITTHPEVMKAITEKLAELPSKPSPDFGTLYGIPVKIDPNQPPGEITIRYSDSDGAFKQVDMEAP